MGAQFVMGVVGMVAWMRSMEMEEVGVVWMRWIDGGGARGWLAGATPPPSNDNEEEEKEDDDDTSQS